MSNTRYHVRLNSHRTTVPMDNILSELLALKLGTKPGTKEAHVAVRKQIDEFVERDRGRPGYGLARYITEQSILFIADKILSDKYLEYCMQEYNKLDEQGP
jgi:hypothetical protein